MAAPHSNVDLSIFKHIHSEDQCGGRGDVKCGAKARIGVLMQYYQAHMAAAKSVSAQQTARQCVMDFCDASYPKAVALSDYIDFVSHHADDAERANLVSTLRLKCDSVGGCALTRRHLRGRRNADATEEQHVRHAIVDRLDTLHFNLMHLEHVGLRERPMGDEEQQVSLEGVDDSINSKFNISVSAATHVEGIVEGTRTKDN